MELPKCYGAVIEREELDVGYLHDVVSKAIGDVFRDFWFRDHLVGQIITKGPTLIGTAENNSPKISKIYEERLGKEAVLEERSTLYLLPTKAKKAAIEKARDQT